MFHALKRVFVLLHTVYMYVMVIVCTILHSLREIACIFFFWTTVTYFEVIIRIKVFVYLHWGKHRIGNDS